MKKIFAFAVLFAAMSLVACGGEQPKAEEAEDVAVEEVVVEEAPAAAPVVKAEKAEKVEVAEEIIEATETAIKVTTTDLKISPDAKEESQFAVKKEPIKTIDASAKVGNTKVRVVGDKKVDEASITVGESTNLKVNTNTEGAKLTIKK